MVRSPRRAVVVLLSLVSAVMLLVAASRPWVRVDLTGRLAGTAEAVVPGADAAPLVPAVALVALAAAAVVAVAARRGARLAGSVVLLAGAGALLATLGVLRDPVAAAVQAVREATGGVDVPAAAVAVTPWPVAAAVAGLLLVACGAAMVSLGRRWEQARRFEPSGRRGAAEQPGSDWDALSRGIDPTAAPRADEPPD